MITQEVLTRTRFCEKLQKRTVDCNYFNLQFQHEQLNAFVGSFSVFVKLQLLYFKHIGN